MNKPDFDGINRVMRVHASTGPHNRAMKFNGSDGGGTATVEQVRSTISSMPASIEKPEDLKAFVAKTQSALLQLSEIGGTNSGALATAAADIKAAHEAVKEVAAQAANLDEIIKAQARLAGAGRKVDEVDASALERLKLRFANNRFDTWERSIPASQFALMSASASDLASMDEGTARTVRLWQDVADDIAIAHALRLSDKNRERANRYVAAGGMKTLPHWKLYERLTNTIRAAMDTAESGAGAEWVPTGVGFALIGDVRPEFDVYRYIERIPMPRSPYLYPVQGAYQRGYRIAQATSDTEASSAATGQISRRDVTTKNLTFTAEKIGAIVFDSSELEEDSIVPLVAAIRAELQTMVEASKESAFINGQKSVITSTTSTYDTSETFTATADDRILWDGIRYHQSLTGVAVDGAGSLTAENMTALKAKLRRFGKVPSHGLWVTGYSGFARLLVLKATDGSLVTLTADKAPGSPTFANGALASAFGSPICVSDLYPETMDATGALTSAGGVLTALHYVNRMRYKHGEVRATLIEASSEFRFDSDQRAVKATYRGQTLPVITPSATETTVGAVVNIAIA